ncbi:hypothetical protein CH313_23350 [Streptomyces sp. TSRI0384-2]|uniref:Uncharacterized protein n=3 Tax=Streptomyces TaxID=1883 RepID=A0A8H9LJA5_9ACTN|nr:hypothetical protein CH313_23350 [Streptomyces sp. TSRI0384-2]SUP59814.1 Uncharacterised protein [Streptomyces griseus]GFH68214.1 hypothetical protein Srut_47280 [Streptomyces rutgersensis]GFH73979.1 hypothetical protein Sdia_47470 [Streptomyces diastaticus subsp. diastaticus]GFH78845.1 hypothetical protein Sgou_35150 [Streptomyces gougerotii]
MPGPARSLDVEPAPGASAPTRSSPGQVGPPSLGGRNSPGAAGDGILAGADGSGEVVRATRLDAPADASYITVSRWWWAVVSLPAGPPDGPAGSGS